MSKYIFIIDTDKYSGNFEREMTAYLTGRIGECEVGDSQAKSFENEVGEVFDNVIDVADEDNGCMRPCVIWTTPGWFNNGVGGMFRDGDEKLAQKHHDNFCKENPASTIPHNSPSKYPSYQSVAIFFESIPKHKHTLLMKERAYMFAKDNELKVSGFRLLEETLTTTEIAI